MGFGDFERFTAQYLCTWGPRAADSLFLAKVEAVVAEAKYELLQQLRKVAYSGFRERDAIEYGRMCEYQANSYIRHRLGKDALVELKVELRGSLYFVTLARSKEFDTIVEHDRISTIGYNPDEETPSPRKTFEAARKVDLG